jgi:hypothetical protein
MVVDIVVGLIFLWLLTEAMSFLLGFSDLKVVTEIFPSSFPYNY